MFMVNPGLQEKNCTCGLSLSAIMCRPVTLTACFRFLFPVVFLSLDLLACYLEYLQSDLMCSCPDLLVKLDCADFHSDFGCVLMGDPM